VEQARFERCRDERLEVAACHRRIGVLGSDDLALFGQADRPVHRARWEGQDRLICRPATAADGAAASVEEPQVNAGASSHRSQRRLGRRQAPLRAEIAAVLVGVGVPHHHLLAVAARSDDVGVHAVVQHRLEDAGAALQILDRLEQRHDVELRAGSTASVSGVGQADFLQQHGDLEDVAEVMRHRDHVVRNDSPSDTADRRCCCFQDRQLGTCPVGDGRTGVTEQSGRAQLGGQQ